MADISSLIKFITSLLVHPTTRLYKYFFVNFAYSPIHNCTSSQDTYTGFPNLSRLRIRNQKPDTPLPAPEPPET